MPKGVAVIAGYGTGISHAVAARLGNEGFAVALISRTQSKLDLAATDFAKNGITAKGFAADLGDAAAVKSAVTKIHGDLGPITILFWNPYGATASLLEVSQAELVREFNVDVTGLVAAVQVAYEDLKAQASKSAVFVTGGALALEADAPTNLAVDWGAVNFATAKAAQRKLVDILNKQLGREGIYAFEVTVMAAVKGTAFDPKGESTLTAEAVANKFWDSYEKRDLAVWNVPIA